MRTLSDINDYVFDKKLKTGKSVLFCSVIIGLNLYIKYIEGRLFWGMSFFIGSFVLYKTSFEEN